MKRQPAHQSRLGDQIQIRPVQLRLDPDRLVGRLDAPRGIARPQRCEREPEDRLRADTGGKLLRPGDPMQLLLQRGPPSEALRISQDFRAEVGVSGLAKRRSVLGPRLEVSEEGSDSMHVFDRMQPGDDSTR